MKLEVSIFQRMSLCPTRMESYGFRRTSGGWMYSEFFMDNAFRADIFIRDDGTVTGRVFDAEMEEEYLPIYAESCGGVYAGTVRRAYGDVLRKIAENCFQRDLFLWPQSNRIAKTLEQKYGEKADFPFSRLPGYGVFRCADNRKWYGLIMNISGEKMDRLALRSQKQENADQNAYISEDIQRNSEAIKKSNNKTISTAKEPADKRPDFEILNLKISSSERRDDLLAVKGIYPGYHLNKSSWISILMDGSLPDSLVLKLLDDSRSSVLPLAGGRKSGTPGGSFSWIVPANPKFFDIDAAFRRSDEIIWKQSSKIRPGDIVYIYVGAPCSALRYRCRVTEADIPYAYRNGNISMTRVMKIRRLETYDAGRYPFAWLQRAGVAAVRGPRRAPPEFLAALEAS